MRYFFAKVPFSVFVLQNRMNTFAKSLACTLIILTAFASSCVREEPSADSTAPITDEDVIEAIRDYHAAWEALEFDRVTSFHADGFEYLFFTDLVKSDAFPAILTDSWMAGVVEYEINETDFRVLAIKPDNAYVSLQVSDRSVYDDGSVARTVGSMTYLLRRDDEWKIIRLHHAGPVPDGLYESEDGD